MRKLLPILFLAGACFGEIRLPVLPYPYNILKQDPDQFIDLSATRDLSTNRNGMAYVDSTAAAYGGVSDRSVAAYTGLLGGDFHYSFDITYGTPTANPMFFVDGKRNLNGGLLIFYTATVTVFQYWNSVAIEQLSVTSQTSLVNVPINLSITRTGNAVVGSVSNKSNGVVSTTTASFTGTVTTVTSPRMTIGSSWDGSDHSYFAKVQLHQLKCGTSPTNITRWYVPSVRGGNILPEVISGAHATNSYGAGGESTYWAGLYNGEDYFQTYGGTKVLSVDAGRSVIPVANLLASDAITVLGTASVTASNGFLNISTGLVAKISINGTNTYQLCSSYSSNVVSVNPYYAGSTFTNGSFRYYPAMASRTNDVLNYGICNPGETSIHNGGAVKVRCRGGRVASLASSNSYINTNIKTGPAGTVYEWTFIGKFIGVNDSARTFTSAVGNGQTGALTTYNSSGRIFLFLYNGATTITLDRSFPEAENAHANGVRIRHFVNTSTGVHGTRVNDGDYVTATNSALIGVNYANSTQNGLLLIQGAGNVVTEVNGTLEYASFTVDGTNYVWEYDASKLSGTNLPNLRGVATNATAFNITLTNDASAVWAGNQSLKNPLWSTNGSSWSSVDYRTLLTATNAIVVTNANGAITQVITL